MNRRIFDTFSELSGWVFVLPDSSMHLSAYTALQGELALFMLSLPL